MPDIDERLRRLAERRGETLDEFNRKMDPLVQRNLEAVRLTVKISDAQVNKRLDEDLTRMHSHGLFNGLLKKAIKTDEPHLVILTSNEGYGTTAYLYDSDEQLIAGKLELEPSGLGRKVLEPHTMFRNVYRGQGYAYALYDMVLRNGVCLVTGGEQSSSANALWWKLTHQWDWFWLEYTDYSVAYLGQQLDPREQRLQQNRMVLLGRGWTVEKFKKEVKMKMPEMAGVIDAKTFADRSEAKKMGDMLVQKLNEHSQFDYSRNDIDNAVSCSGDVDDAVSDMARLGYRPFTFKKAGWNLERRLRNAVFMSVNGQLPIVVREPASGFGTVITFLGKSLQKFQILDEMRALLAPGADISLETMVPGTIGLCVTCDIDKEVRDIINELEHAGFVKTPSGHYLNKRVGLYVQPVGRKLRFIDSMF